MAFISFSKTVIPPWILDAPAKAAWPPLLMAKGQPVYLDRSTRIETSVFSDGLKMQ
jgi:hypothetical protein